MVSCRFSLKPIQWEVPPLDPDQNAVTNGQGTSPQRWSCWRKRRCYDPTGPYWTLLDVRGVIFLKGDVFMFQTASLHLWCDLQVNFIGDTKSYQPPAIPKIRPVQDSSLQVGNQQSSGLLFGHMSYDLWLLWLLGPKLDVLWRDIFLIFFSITHGMVGHFFRARQWQKRTTFRTTKGE